MWLFYYFNFERNYDFLKSKGSCILLNKNVNFIKNGTESKMENSTRSFRETNLGLHLIKNRKLKTKLWWVGDRKRKKRAFFLLFILCKGIFFNICVLSQCIVYWIQFQNIHTFAYEETLLFAFCFKIVEYLQCILNERQNQSQ